MIIELETGQVNLRRITYQWEDGLELSMTPAERDRIWWMVGECHVRYEAALRYLAEMARCGITGHGQNLPAG